MTYMLGGERYLAVAIGGGNYTAFRLLRA